MQRIEFVGTEKITQVDEITDLNQMDEAELVTDPNEIMGIIRRAVTILWNNSLFTYDELAAHLKRNYIELPESVAERDEFLETAIQSIWHTQKELARAAFTTLPTRLRHFDTKTHQTLHGLAVPLSLDFIPIANEPAETIIRQPGMSVSPIADVIEINEKQPGFTQPEIAKRIFEIMMKTNELETVIGVQKLKAIIKAERPLTEASFVDTVIGTMVENGYVMLRKTGHKRNTRRNVVMVQATKHEVQADIEDGIFDEGLNYIFNKNVLTLSS